MITSGPSGILVVSLVVAMSVIRYVIAREYTVGSGDVCVTELWKPGVCDYDQWAQQYEFAVGDTLVFNFSPEDSTVAEVTKTYYDMCSVTSIPDISPKYVYKKSPQTITLSTTGTFYFVNTLYMCSIQRMAIIVNATHTSDTDSESTSPSASSGAASDSLPASSSSSSSTSSSHNKTVGAVVGSLAAFILFTAKISIAVYCYRRRQQRHRLNAQGRPPNEAAPVLHHAHVEMNYQGDYDAQRVPASNYNA